MERGPKKDKFREVLSVVHKEVEWAFVNLTQRGQSNGHQPISPLMASGQFSPTGSIAAERNSRE